MVINFYIKLNQYDNLTRSNAVYDIEMYKKKKKGKKEKKFSFP